MELLVLGGTSFLGRHLVDQALQLGHNVAIFTRGLTNPGLFPEAEHVIGDRSLGLAGIAGRSFDAVIDTSGYHPRPVGESARAFSDSLYCFVSSISAYRDLSRPGISESAPLAELDGPVPDDFDPQYYGALKVMCEQTVADLAPRTLIIRPGLIVGPHDPTDRFTYWPVRGQRGGTILAPGPAARIVQIIDARDLAAWMLALVSEGRTGIYNAVASFTMGEIMTACAVEHSEIVWASDETLARFAVKEWTELPLWIRKDGAHAGMLACDTSKALDAGFASRPIDTIARDTLEWFLESNRNEDSLKCGLSRTKETEILKAI